MLLWFVIVAPVVVAEVFRSPMLDYRLVAVGAALPLIEVVVGQVFVLHTLLAPVFVLTAVMLSTMGRRLLRRRLLGIPIGLFLHLALDGSWNSAELFWWPAFGFSFDGLSTPETSGVWFRLVLEIVAVGVGVVAYRRYGLDEPAARVRLARTGHLPAIWRDA